MGGQGGFLRTGALVVLGLGLLVGILWYLGGDRFRHGEVLESYFHESVQGLDVGAPVKYRGVTVGRVTAVGLVSAEYGGKAADLDRSVYRQVFVRYLVDTSKMGVVPSLRKAIALGLRARIVSQVLTGVGYIELDFVDPRAYPWSPPPWTPRDPVVPSVPSTFTQVQDAAQALLAKIDRIDLDGLAGGIQRLVATLQADLTTGDIHRTFADADALLRTARGQLRAADLPATAAALRGTAAALTALARSPALGRTLANGARASAQLVALAGQLSRLATSVQSATGEEAAQFNARLDPILRDLAATARNLRAVTETLRQYPGALLAAPPPR